MEYNTTQNYIDADRQIMIEYHGGAIFLEGLGTLMLFTTNDITDKNPITGAPLSSEVLAYVKFRDQCYRYTKNISITEEVLNDIFKWYSDSRREEISILELRNSPETREAYNIARFYMTATDFQSHFRTFNPSDSNMEKYERDLATKALLNSGIVGKWLLRHSSRNRPEEKDEQNKLLKLGIRYYALSYLETPGKIQHILITCKIGKGWNSGGRWYTNFLDCLENTLAKNGLNFHSQISSYLFDD